MKPEPNNVIPLDDEAKARHKFFKTIKELRKQSEKLKKKLEKLEKQGKDEK